MTSNKDNCKGCLSRRICKPTVNYSRECPCVKCLIKVTCDIGCEDFSEYYDKFQYAKEKEYNKALDYQGKVMAR